ncbi:hypothetical protein E4U21_002561 [Claviceps maximensis]|nr:hypothetical protein E4U21_002561 [Claviceps maximensis]
MHPTMDLDTDVLINAGMSGIGLAAQLTLSRQNTTSTGTRGSTPSSNRPSGMTSRPPWLVYIRELDKNGKTYRRRCNILISAVGVLSVPKERDVEGASSFQGPLFHTARWHHSFDWTDKEVIVIGTTPSFSSAS